MFLKGLHAAERSIAERLSARAAGAPPWPDINLGNARPWAEQKTGKVLSPSQAEAVRLMLGAKLSILTGGPGVGNPPALVERFG
ncbi:hypothetical protein [Methylobacterium nodulans]|uniref:hypothetical protein n=1 Tax=Methylobacterium nodulans TaxID=114616 RepID=UPI0001618F64